MKNITTQNNKTTNPVVQQIDQIMVNSNKY